MSDLDQLDKALAGGGAPSAFTKDTPVGTTISGTVISAELRQITDFATQKPKTWDDGRPQMQVVVRLQTDQRDPSAEDDTGERRVFIKTWGVWKEALNQAIREAGGTKASDVLQPGATFTATFTGTKPSTMGSPMKVYTYKIQPRAAAGLDQALDTQAPAAASAGLMDGDPVEKANKAKQLIALGLDDATIASTVGLDTSVIVTLRQAA